jgi:hypothetical protein
LAARLEPAAKLATLVTAVAGAGLIYVLGGLAMALRLEGSRFPIEEGLKVVPREVLLLLGVRELLLVLLAVAAILWLRSYLVWIASALLLIAPLTLEGLFWPLGLLIVYALWRYSPFRPFERAAVACSVFAIIAVPLRFTDPPFRFPATLVYASKACMNLELALAPDLACKGGLISSASSGIYLGAPPGVVGKHSPARIVFIPSSQIRDMVLVAHFAVAPRASPNGDEKLDLAVASLGNDVRVLLGNGGGGFRPATDSPFPLPEPPFFSSYRMGSSPQTSTAIARPTSPCR